MYWEPTKCQAVDVGLEKYLASGPFEIENNLVWLNAE